MFYLIQEYKIPPGMYITLEKPLEINMKQYVTSIRKIDGIIFISKGPFTGSIFKFIIYLPENNISEDN